MISAYLRFSDLLARLGLILAGLVLVGMLGLILTEILFRAVLGTSTFIMDEFVGYGVAATTFLALSHTLQQGKVIRMGLVIEQLRPRARRYFDIASIIVALAVTSFLMHFSWLRFDRAWERGSVSNSLAKVPMTIPEGILLLGLFMLLLQLVALLLRTLQGQSTPIFSDTTSE